MKIVVLDGYTLNPGDITWERFERIGDVTFYDRTPAEKIVERKQQKKKALQCPIFQLMELKWCHSLPLGFC